MEDYRQGQRIRSYKIEGLADGKWMVLCAGQSIGRKKIDYFPDAEVSEIRIVVDRHVGTPLIWNFAAFYVEDFIAPPKTAVRPYASWKQVAEWNPEEFAGGRVEFKIDLSKDINLPGQYSIQLIPDNEKTKIKIEKAQIYYEGRKALDEFITIKGNDININRTAMVTDESSSVLLLRLKSAHPGNGKVKFRPALIY